MDCADNGAIVPATALHFGMVQCGPNTTDKGVGYYKTNYFAIDLSRGSHDACTIAEMKKYIIPIRDSRIFHIGI